VAGCTQWWQRRNAGQRTLEMATLVSLLGPSGETAFTAAQRFCRIMAQGTVVPEKRGSTFVDVMYGSNDWYYAYGKNTRRHPAGCGPGQGSGAGGGPEPFSVIDDGYQDVARFPDMARLASEIRSRGVKPGLWIRPLRAAATVPANLLLPNERWKEDGSRRPPLAYDPTIAEALEAIAAVATEACGWDTS